MSYHNPKTGKPVSQEVALLNIGVPNASGTVYKLNNELRRQVREMALKEVLVEYTTGKRLEGAALSPNPDRICGKINDLRLVESIMDKDLASIVGTIHPYGPYAVYLRDTLLGINSSPAKFTVRARITHMDPENPGHLVEQSGKKQVSLAKIICWELTYGEQ
jgi:hypothetical protein